MLFPSSRSSRRNGQGNIRRSNGNSNGERFFFLIFVEWRSIGDGGGNPNPNPNRFGTGDVDQIIFLLFFLGTEFVEETGLLLRVTAVVGRHVIVVVDCLRDDGRGAIGEVSLVLVASW